MAETFKVGEIAIGVKPVHFIDPLGCDGVEVVVIEGLAVRKFDDGEEHDSYLVRTADGPRYRAMPHWLRKKPLPAIKREELGEWELCPWKHPVKQPALT